MIIQNTISAEAPCRADSAESVDGTDNSMVGVVQLAAIAPFVRLGSVVLIGVLGMSMWYIRQHGQLATTSKKKRSLPNRLRKRFHEEQDYSSEEDDQTTHQKLNQSDNDSLSSYPTSEQSNLTLSPLRPIWSYDQEPDIYEGKQHPSLQVRREALFEILGRPGVDFPDYTDSSISDSDDSDNTVADRSNGDNYSTTTTESESELELDCSQSFNRSHKWTCLDYLKAEKRKTLLKHIDQEQMLKTAQLKGIEGSSNSAESDIKNNKVQKKENKFLYRFFGYPYVNTSDESDTEDPNDTQMKARLRKKFRRGNIEATKSDEKTASDFQQESQAAKMSIHELFAHLEDQPRDSGISSNNSIDDSAKGLAENEFTKLVEPVCEPRRYVLE